MKTFLKKEHDFFVGWCTSTIVTTLVSGSSNQSINLHEKMSIKFMFLWAGQRNEKFPYCVLCTCFLLHILYIHLRWIFKFSIFWIDDLKCDIGSIIIINTQNTCLMRISDNFLTYQLHSLLYDGWLCISFNLLFRVGNPWSIFDGSFKWKSRFLYLKISDFVVFWWSKLNSFESFCKCAIPWQTIFSKYPTNL